MCTTFTPNLLNVLNTFQYIDHPSSLGTNKLTEELQGVRWKIELDGYLSLLPRRTQGIFPIIDGKDKFMCRHN